MFSPRYRSRFAAALALAALTLAGLLSACLMETPPAPVAVATPTPTPVPTPSPSEFVDYDAYFRGTQAVEKIPAPLAAATEELRLAAALDALKTARAENPNSGSFFIAIGANENELRDPADTLLAKIKMDGINIKKFTQCVNNDSGVRDGASGAKGILIKVVRICWTTSNCALVHYGYSTGGIHGCMTMAEAERVGGAWIFTPRKVAIY